MSFLFNLKREKMNSEDYNLPVLEYDNYDTTRWK